MKTMNEKMVNELLTYIRNYQTHKGLSPSFRDICNNVPGFKSIATAQKYVLLLESRGLIKRNRLGSIETPKRLQGGTTITAPLVGNVACGQPIFAEENIQGYYRLPKEIFGGGKKMLLRAQGSSMIGVGINDGDLLVVDCCDNADLGQIVVALVGDSATVKTLQKKKGKIILHPENPEFQDIEPEELKIQGVVTKVIHSV